jgi:hypothetical protein
LSDVNAGQTGVWNVGVNAGLPTGANLIGNVSVSVLPGLSTGANVVGLVNTNADAAIGAGTAPAKSLVVGAVYNSSLPSPSTGQTVALQVDAGGRLITNGAVTIGGLSTGANNIGVVNVAGGIIAQNAAYLTTNPLVTGGVYYAAQPTINANSATWMSMTTRAGLIVATGADTFNVTVNAALPAGTAVIGLVNTNADAAIGAGTAPAKAFITGGVYNSSAPAPTNGQTVALQLDAAGRLITNAGSLALSGLLPSTNTIGAVYTAGVEVENNPVVNNTVSYTAGWVIGGIQTFSNILPSTLQGRLKSLMLKFKATLQTTEFDVAIFNTSPTGTFADHAAPAIATTDTPFLMGIYRMVAFQSCLGTHTIYNLDGIEQRVTGLTTSLFAVVITKAIPTNPASTSDMYLRLGVDW